MRLSSFVLSTLFSVSVFAGPAPTPVTQSDANQEKMDSHGALKHEHKEVVPAHELKAGQAEKAKAKAQSKKKTEDDKKTDH